MSTQLRERAYKTLLTGAREVSPEADYDSKGYVANWRDKLFPGLPLSVIETDLSAGAGSELDGKLSAAHSSAALAVNCFGPWRDDPSSLSLCGLKSFRSMAIEATCPTGLRGTAPHLDLLLEGDLPVAVESKFTEWMEGKPAAFSASYARLKQHHGESPWFEQMLRLRLDPKRYRFLDAAQLAKHAFGLLTKFGTNPVNLIYLYWEPANALSWPECADHREEAEELAGRVKDSNVKLKPMSYRELWAEWEIQGAAAHLAYLRLRYEREV